MSKEERTEKVARTESEEKLSAILTICQRMSSERDLAALLDLIAREAARLLGADRSTIFLLDKKKKQLWSWVALESEEIRDLPPRTRPPSKLDSEPFEVHCTG